MNPKAVVLGIAVAAGSYKIFSLNPSLSLIVLSALIGTAVIWWMVGEFAKTVHASPWDVLRDDTSRIVRSEEDPWNPP